MGKIIDITGGTFGRVKVNSFHGLDKGSKAEWNCTCSCGTKFVTLGKSLRAGLTQSCGCLQKERASEANFKHGHAKRMQESKSTFEYTAYRNAHARCTNPKCDKFSYYGGRGIKFLFTSFEQFFTELGTKPKGRTLDRINNNGNYEPGNVRWATKDQQNANKRAPNGKNICT
jgi:hypothetical protein